MFLPVFHGRTEKTETSFPFFARRGFSLEEAQRRDVPSGQRAREMGGRKRCPHGKLDFSCAACNNPCPHGKRKDHCAACKGCPHGKLKDKCVHCRGCPHRKLKYSCVQCSACPHGKLKYSCVHCGACPHGNVKYFQYN